MCPFSYWNIILLYRIGWPSWKTVWLFFNYFFFWNDHIVLPFSLLTWSIVFIHLQRMNCPSFPEINHKPSWRLVFFTCHWTGLFRKSPEQNSCDQEYWLAYSSLLWFFFGGGGGVFISGDCVCLVWFSFSFSLSFFLPFFISFL